MNVVENEFNALAHEYESNRLSAWYQAHADEILRHCVQLGEGDILDVGCGTGYFLRRYLRDRPNVRAVGIDTSATMIEVAQGKARAEGIDTVEFIHADWETFDPKILQDYQFRAIFCANAFHYFNHPQVATEKLFAQLANGGTLYLLERNKARSLLTFFWGILHTLLIRDQVSFYKTSELVEMFKRAGLEEIKILSTLKKYFWKNKLYTSVVLISGTRK